MQQSSASGPASTMQTHTVQTRKSSYIYLQHFTTPPCTYHPSRQYNQNFVFCFTRILDWWTRARLNCTNIFSKLSCHVGSVWREAWKARHLKSEAKLTICPSCTEHFGESIAFVFCQDQREEMSTRPWPQTVSNSQMTCAAPSSSTFFYLFPHCLHVSIYVCRVCLHYLALFFCRAKLLSWI